MLWSQYLCYEEDCDWAIFAYELTDQPTKKGQEVPGNAVLVYSKNRLLKQRLDYYDPLTWVWALATDKREPYLWVYADAGGNYVILNE